MDSRSPSFNSYSSNGGRATAEIADRVVKEFACSVEGEAIERGNEEDEGFEFEFGIVAAESVAPITADEIFVDGKIRPVYPVFGRDLYVRFRGLDGSENSDPDKAPAIRLPLRKWFTEERETSCSSSETDDLDGVPAETYCVWRPIEARCNKSNSTGSLSRRWMLRVKELLQRSHSDVSSNVTVIGRRKGEDEERNKSNNQHGRSKFYWKKAAK